MEKKEAQEAAQEQNNARAKGNPEQRASTLVRISFTRITDTTRERTQHRDSASARVLEYLFARLVWTRANATAARVPSRAPTLEPGLGRRTCQWGWEGAGGVSGAGRE